MENSRRTRITQKEFSAYILFPRNEIFNQILRVGKQFQQYIVDSWFKSEINRLNYFRKKSERTQIGKSGLQRGLQDYMAGDENQNGPPGRKVILGGIFVGDLRYMVAQYQDAQYHLHM